MIRINKALLFISILYSNVFNLCRLQQVKCVNQSPISNNQPANSANNAINHVNENKQISNRSLRGGSRSGSSSHHSSSSSSGRWYHRNNHNSNYHNSNYNNYNNHYGTMRRVFTGLAIGAVGLALLAFLAPALGIGGIATGCCACCACIAGLCCGAGLTAASSRPSYPDNDTNHYFNYGNSDNDEENIQYLNNEFEKMVQNTKYEIENTINNEETTIQPYSGIYNTSFIDPESGVRHDAILSLYFTKDLKGYKILGQGSDIDGETLIEDGFVSNDGSAAWWRERVITGHVGLQVLSKGRFDFYQRAFYGVWIANSNITASYLSFCATGSDENAIPIAHAVPATVCEMISSVPFIATAPNNVYYTNTPSAPSDGYYVPPTADIKNSGNNGF